MSNECTFLFDDEQSAHQLTAALESLGGARLTKRDAHTGLAFHEVAVPIPFLLAGISVVKTWIRERAATQRATRFRYGGLEIAAIDPDSAEDLILLIEALQQRSPNEPAS